MPGKGLGRLVLGEARHGCFFLFRSEPKLEAMGMVLVQKQVTVLTWWLSLCPLQQGRNAASIRSHSLTR